jgi:hypothetical protein
MPLPESRQPLLGRNSSATLSAEPAAEAMRASNGPIACTCAMVRALLPASGAITKTCTVSTD